LILNPIYEALIAEIDRWGGSVIGFSGDAVTVATGKVLRPGSYSVLYTKTTAVFMMKVNFINQEVVWQIPRWHR
jgi:hypothetical protein